MCAYCREIGIFAHEDPVRAVVELIWALDPAWMPAMQAIPRYTRALREQPLAYDGRLLGRDLVTPGPAIWGIGAAPALEGHSNSRAQPGR